MGKKKNTRPLYVKDYYVVQSCVAVWDDFPVIGALEESTTYSKKYGPFTQEEAEKKKKKLVNSITKEIKEDRQAVRSEFGVSEAKLYHKSLEQHFSPSDFYFSHSIESCFKKISSESVA